MTQNNSETENVAIQDTVGKNHVKKMKQQARRAANKDMVNQKVVVLSQTVNIILCLNYIFQMDECESGKQSDEAKVTGVQRVGFKRSVCSSPVSE